MTYDKHDDAHNQQLNNDEPDVHALPTAENNAKVRRKIDDLLEQKRLKDLLDDWDSS
ncbi:hypothetical protein Q4489_13835 [Thalassotalea sp. 1_MG-2023]|uniref:PA3496 family putative envelope integrity protein n=1 Tax=Thalassotalea sp. 1_MG-2023 TaxID=3062680 RepID=UPI0026E1E437|nr:hypothetical protein [Thalassotalea sp. 1_MG-2023]MDO6428096.1 hypothetical protein [Thalassotalea sp. 1_MG-2023]